MKKKATESEPPIQAPSDVDGATQPIPRGDVFVRTIESHRVNPANDRLVIEVLDLPGDGNACHAYRISGFDTEGNPSCPFAAVGDPARTGTIVFQNGPIAEVGVNGVTHEALLAIIEDRMVGFQGGPFACDENRMALAHLQQAIRFLQLRTKRRMEAGTEGTHEGN